jgi:hypothetical protein
LEGKILQSREKKALLRLMYSPDPTTPTVSSSRVEGQKPTTVLGGDKEKVDGYTLTCTDNGAGETCGDRVFGGEDMMVKKKAWNTEATLLTRIVRGFVSWVSMKDGTGVSLGERGLITWLYARRRDCAWHAGEEDIGRGYEGENSYMISFKVSC